MRKPMPIGIDDFKKVRENYYLVDKTDIIRKLIDTHAEVTLFTRPRRFGKTLTMSMLDYFFSIDKKAYSEALFKDMNISKAGTPYMKEWGKYPVIFMTLKDCAELNWADTYEQFKIFIKKEFQKHSYLIDGDILRPEEKASVQRILDGTASVAEYKCSLGDLSAYLHRYFKEKTIILLDEHDAPLQAAYSHGFYEEAIAFFRRCLSIALKGNGNLHFAVLTGVQRIAKESIFSGLNNLDVYSVLSKQYDDAFGFTTEEVRQLASDLGYSEKAGELKQWYDGYTFGTCEIYNPWSVIKYFASSCVPAPYWISTSNNSILQLLLHKAGYLQFTALQNLLRGDSVIAGLNENVVYNALDIDQNSLYTMLLTAGYLTVASVIDQADNIYALRIPNEEIKRVYRIEILDTLLTGSNRMTFEDLFIYLLSGQEEQFAVQLQRIITQFVSIYDATNKESFYHGFMLGMIALFLHKEYVIESNRESGYGRFDIAIFPRNIAKAGVILEFKVAPTEKELPKKAVEALKQIEQQAYFTEFKKRGIQTVWKYGVSFCRKHVVITQSHA